jgi:hypothetical protein
MKKIAMQKELTANKPQQALSAEEPPTTKLFYPSNSTRQEIEHKFKNIIHEELKLGSLVSYVRTKMTERKYKGDTFHNQWQSFRVKKNLTERKYKGDTFHNQWQSFRVKKNPKEDYETKHKYHQTLQPPILRTKKTSAFYLNFQITKSKSQTISNIKILMTKTNLSFERLRRSIALAM